MKTPEIPTTRADFFSVSEELMSLRMKLIDLGIREHPLNALNVAIALMEREAEKLKR